MRRAIDIAACAEIDRTALKASLAVLHRDALATRGMVCSSVRPFAISSGCTFAPRRRRTLRRLAAYAGKPCRSPSWPTTCGPSCWPERPPPLCAAGAPAIAAARGWLSCSLTWRGGLPPWLPPPTAAETVHCRPGGCLQEIDGRRSIAPLASSQARPRSGLCVREVVARIVMLGADPFGPRSNTITLRDSRQVNYVPVVRPIRHLSFAWSCTHRLSYALLCPTTRS